MPAGRVGGGGTCQRRRGCRVLCTRWGSALSGRSQRAFSRRWSADLRIESILSRRLAPNPRSTVLRKRAGIARESSSSRSTRFVPFSGVTTRETTVCAERLTLWRNLNAERIAVRSSLSQVTPAPPPPARPRTPPRGSVACRIWWFSSRRHGAAAPTAPPRLHRVVERTKAALQRLRGLGRRIASPRAPPGCARRANPAPPASSATPSIGRRQRYTRASRRPRGHHPRAPPRPPEPWAFLVFLAVPLFPTARVRFPVSCQPSPARIPFVLFANESTLTRSPPPPLPLFFQDSAFSIAPRSPPRASRPVYPVVTISSRRWRRRSAPAARLDESSSITRRSRERFADATRPSAPRGPPSVAPPATIEPSTPPRGDSPRATLTAARAVGAANATRDDARWWRSSANVNQTTETSGWRSFVGWRCCYPRRTSPGRTRRTARRRRARRSRTRSGRARRATVAGGGRRGGGDRRRAARPREDHRAGRDEGRRAPGSSRSVGSVCRRVLREEGVPGCGGKRRHGAQGVPRQRAPVRHLPSPRTRSSRTLRGRADADGDTGVRTGETTGVRTDVANNLTVAERLAAGSFAGRSTAACYPTRSSRRWRRGGCAIRARRRRTDETANKAARAPSTKV